MRPSTPGAEVILRSSLVIRLLQVVIPSLLKTPTLDDDAQEQP